MAQVLPGSATSTETVRRATRNGEEILGAFGTPWHQPTDRGNVEEAGPVAGLPTPPVLPLKRAAPQTMQAVVRVLCPYPFPEVHDSSLRTDAEGCG
jgi:hypothetical protein